MNEREVSLVDLMVETLLHWRGIIVLMLIGGVLSGAFSYARSAQSVRQQTAEAERTHSEAADRLGTLEKAKAELTEAEQNNIDYVLYYERLYQEKAIYLEQSVLMQMDPDQMYRADITFLVRAGDLESAYNLEKVYEDFANSSELMELLAEKCQVPASLLGEIYMLSRGSEGKIKDTDAFNVVAMQGINTFEVTIMHYDEKACQELAQTIVNYIKQKQDELIGKMGEHEIVVLNQSVGTTGDMDVLKNQNSAREELLALRSSAEKLKDAFSEKEKYCYDLMVAVGEESDSKEGQDENESTDVAIIETVPTPRVSLKYILLGMIFAAFAYVFILFMMYVLNNKLRSTDQFQELYNIPQLGQIPEEEKKKVFGFVDQWILTLRYWNQRKFTFDEALNLTAVAVKMAAGKEALDTVCLMGCDLKAQAMEDCEKIKELLGREKVGVKILDNVLYDAEAMEELEKVKGVVLVEKAGSTLYTEIAQELELLNRQEIKILGGVIIG